MAVQSNSKRSVAKRWDDYQPTKSTLMWACVACVAVTLVAGFTWGGWVTGATARDAASSAGSSARAELAATICVERFNAAPEAEARRAELKEIRSSYQRREFVEKGGWAMMPGETSGDRDSAEKCAAALYG